MDNLNIVSNPYTGIMSRFSSWFQKFIKDIGDAKSKSEEDRIISREISFLKNSAKKEGITSKDIKERIVCMIHCKMLGHDVSFAYMNAVNFVQQQSLLEKRVAYVSLSLFLEEHNERECMMNVSSMQKDLRSHNQYQICFGLIAASKLVFKDMVPVFIEVVADLMKHENGFLRKKAVMTMLKFYQLDAELVKPFMKLFHNALLCDTDPSVMSVSLNAFTHLIAEDSAPFKRTTSSFVIILKQILNRMLPKDFDHRGVPSPWLQIKILRILAMLGSDDMTQSKEMYEMLKECLTCTDMEQQIGCAVVHECIKTIATIYPNRALIQLAAGKARLFLMSKNNNLKYLGIITLSNLIHIDVSYGMESQMDIIECLSDPDDSIKRKTLDLLYRMTSTNNVKIICDEFIKYLRYTVDDYVKSDLVTKITILTEKYAPDNEWFIDTMNEVFEMGGDLVQSDVAHNMMRIIGEGIDNGDDDEDDEATDDLRRNAVITYTILLQKPSLPDILIQLICWVVGEYIELLENYNIEELTEQFYALLKRKFSNSVTQSWVVNAIGKVISKFPEPLKHLKKIDLNSLNCDAKQRYKELEAVFNSRVNLEELFPYDENCEDIDVDLSFLDAFVNDELQRGALPYSIELKESCAMEKTVVYQGFMSGMKVTEYEAPPKPGHTTTLAPDRSSPLSSGSASSGERSIAAKKQQPIVWTKDGLLRKQPLSPVDTTDTSNSDVTSQQSGDAELSSQSSSDKEVSSTSGDCKEYRSQNAFARVETKPDPKKKLAERLFSSDVHIAPASRLLRKDGAARHKRQPQLRKLSTDRPLIDMTENQAQNIEEDCLAEGTINVNSSQNGDDCFSGLILTEGVTMEKKNQLSTQLSGLSNQTNILQNGLSQSSTSVLQQPQKCLLDEELVEQELYAVKPRLDTAIDEINKLSISVPNEFSSFKYSTQQDVCTDMNLRLMWQYVYKPTELAIVLYCVNQSVQTLTDIKLVIQLPSNLRGNVHEFSTVIESLDTMLSFNHVINATYQSPALNMALSGQVSYKDYTNTEKRIFLHLPLSTSTLLRELELNLEEFQVRWKDRSLYEKKESIEKICQMDKLIEVMRSINVYPVQIINTELLCATTILGKQEILIYGKLASLQIEFRIKSGSRLLNNSLMKMFSALQFN